MERTASPYGIAPFSGIPENSKAVVDGSLSSAFWRSPTETATSSSRTQRAGEAAVRTIAAGVIYAFDRQREPVPQGFFFREEVPPLDKVKAPLIVSRDAASIGGVDITPELCAIQKYWASLPGAGAYENLLDAFAATVELYGDMAVDSVSQLSRHHGSGTGHC